jgi:hypothetical protein
MGIQIADSITFKNGLTLSNTILTIKGQILRINSIQSGASFRVFYSTYQFASNDAYSASPQSEPLQICNDLYIDLSPSQINGDIYTAIYDNIKSSYQTTSDI